MTHIFRTCRPAIAMLKGSHRLHPAVVLAWIAFAASAAEPDLILHHGKIVTVDGKYSIQQALAVEGSHTSQERAFVRTASIYSVAGGTMRIRSLP